MQRKRHVFVLLVLCTYAYCNGYPDVPSLDNKARQCSAVGKLAAEVDREKVKSCVSTVIFDYWVKAAAKAWYDGSCQVNEPLECKTCCFDYVTGEKYQGDCECEAWTDYCDKWVYQRTLVVAQGIIEGKLNTSTSSCDTTVTDKLTDVVTSLIEPVRSRLN